MNLLVHKGGRSISVFAFYFAEGVPIGFIWWALPTLMRQNGADLHTIGSVTALLTLPWVFKFLWAPLVDIFRSPKFGFTKWILVTQCLMCISIIPLLFIPLKDHTVIWGSCLFLHSMFASTQDVSVDALVISIVPKNEKGMLNGYMQAGMLIGRSIFGGVILIFAQKMGLQFTIILMIAAITASMMVLLFVKEPGHNYDQKKQLPEFKKNLLTIISSRQTWYSIAFALTAGAAFEAAGAFAGPFLTDHNASQESIGLFFALPVVVCMLIGGLAGGFLSDKLDRRKSLAFFLCLIVVMVLTLCYYTFFATETSPLKLMVVYGLMYLFTGMFTTSSYALFMDVTNPELGATQFSTFMAATNGCEAWVVFVAGIITASQGYGLAFLLMCTISLLSLIFLIKMSVRKQVTKSG